MGSCGVGWLITFDVCDVEPIINNNNEKIYYSPDDGCLIVLPIAKLYSALYLIKPIEKII